MIHAGDFMMSFVGFCEFQHGQSKEKKNVTDFWKFRQIIGFIWKGACIQISLVLVSSSFYALLMQSLEQRKGN